MSAEKEALEYLSREPMANADMISCIRRGMADIISADAGGVLLRVRDDEVLMVAADEPERAREIAAMTPEKCVGVSSHGDVMCAAMASARPGAFARPCIQTVWTSRVRPEPSGPAEIRPLGAEYTDFVAEHYSLDLGRDYISEAIRRGGMFGAFVGGEPAGFIGLHLEGAMGMLEVLPEYKRRGIGGQLERFMLCRELDAWNVPYGQIICGNRPSFLLAEKLGWAFAPRLVTWFLED